MRSVAVAIVAGLIAAGCGGATADRQVTALAQTRLGSSGDCQRLAMAVFWRAYHANLPLYSCAGRRRGWCVVASPDKTAVVDVTAYMYRALHRADADWQTRPACLSWRGIERFRLPGGDPEVATLPSRLNRR